MPDPNSLMLFIIAGLVLNITPGPDVLYIVGRSLSQGRMAGVASALGIGAGCLFHVSASALGLSALMQAVPLAFDLIRWAGAAYMAWLGIRALLSKAGPLQVDEMQRESMWRIFRQGMVTNILNPKVALFFLAFLPQFADPTRGPLPMQIALLGAIFIFNGMLVCLAYALVASWLGGWLKSRYGVAAWLNRAMGVTFLGLGLRLAAGERR